MSQRLWTGLAVFVLLVAGASLFISEGLRTQAHTIDTLSTRLGPIQALSHKAATQFGVAQTVLRTTLADPRRDPAHPPDLGTYQAALEPTLSRLSGFVTGTERADVAAEQHAAARWFSQARALLALPAGSRRVPGMEVASYASVREFFTADGHMQEGLRSEDLEEVAADRRAVTASVTGSGVLGLVLVLLALVVAAAVLIGIIRPLGGFAAVLRRLTSGDHGARAQVRGPTEIAAVAASLNALADEGHRLRAHQAEADRLKATARAAGLRIHEQLRVADLVREAKEAIEQDLGAEVAYVRVSGNGQLPAPAVGDVPAALLDSVAASLGKNGSQLCAELLRRQAAMVIPGAPGPGVAGVAPATREALAAAGGSAAVLAPFGVGDDVLGVITAVRKSSQPPWTGAEVDAITMVAADLGRGMHHARLYEAENRLVAELRSVDRAKSDFLAAVSHELRTPLTSIAGAMEILRGGEPGPLTPDQQKLLESADRNTARLRQMIEDVLTLSKIESGAFRTMRQPVVLSELVTSAVSVLTPMAAARGLSMSCGEMAHGLTVNGDPGQLDKLLMNLLSNSVKFTPHGGTVLASVDGDGARAVLSVTDTGIGIPEQDQKALFTRFFRASNAVEAAMPGTGLGLAIVRTIVANHDGELRVSSQVGQGTTVTVLLPLLADGEVAAPRVPVGGGGRQS